jgi:hypothetical protein
MDMFWSWNFTPFIDFFLLGEKNKHYELPPGKKLIFGKTPMDEIVQQLQTARVLMLHGDHFSEWNNLLLRIAKDFELDLPIQLFLSFGSDYKFLSNDLEALVETFSKSEFWYQNWCGDLERVTLLPIGMDNNAGLITVDSNLIQKKYNLVISSFTVNSEARREFVNFLDKHPELSVFCAPFYSDKNEFFKMLSEHYFSVCVSGNGYDTYRLWESILAKCVPIVVKNEFTLNLKKQYPNLPMIIFETWEELVDSLPNFTKEYYTTFWKKADIQCSTNAYWHAKLSELVNIP